MASTVPDATKTFNRKLSGRLAILGLAIGLITKALTDRGILDQVFGIFASGTTTPLY